MVRFKVSIISPGPQRQSTFSWATLSAASHSMMRWRGQVGNVAARSLARQTGAGREPRAAHDPGALRDAGLRHGVQSGVVRGS